MIKERKEFRKEREKHFEHADHSLTAAVYGEPVHFMENGEWKEIDNTVEVNAEGRYENRHNDMKVSFALDASDGKLVEIQKDGHRLSWKMEGIQKRPPQMKKPVDRKPNEEKQRPEDAMALHTLACGVDYANVQEDMDLSYVLKSKTLKENVIFKQMPKDPKITFEITTALIPVQSGGRVVFQTEDGTDIFIMPAP